jgi:hypothetical protein
MMIRKKVDSKLAHSGRSLASRLLGGAVLAPVPVNPPNEPWRDNKARGKNRRRLRS